MPIPYASAEATRNTFAPRLSRGVRHLARPWHRQYPTLPRTKRSAISSAIAPPHNLLPKEDESRWSAASGPGHARAWVMSR